MNFYKELKNFIEQAKTNDLKTASYQKEYQGLKVKVSFGQGNQAKVPWISFLGKGQTTSNGIYPVYLLYKKARKLVLAYGVSETKPPVLKWNVDAPTVKDYFAQYNSGDANPYPNSYVYKVYDLKYKLNEEEVNKDLDALIAIYRNTLSHKGKSPSMTKRTEKFDYKQFYTSATQAGLITSDTQCLRFIASLLTKRFVICTGLSGSGKTKLAQAFAKWICESEDQYRLIPIGADWTNREPLLGFVNSLEKERYLLPDSGALTLLLDAIKVENAHKPYFLILDEMNLSHVERYFADFLSVMESGEAIVLHSGKNDWDNVPPQLKLPANLFLIGTVNIDETTYMFSPKVLDRANVIEFRVNADEIKRYLQGNVQVDLNKLRAAGAGMAADFLRWTNDKSITNKHTKEFRETLLDFFIELKKAGAEFGYRSAAEMNRFAALSGALNTDWRADEIMDAVIMQKLLPKVHGSRRKLEPVLKKLGHLCMNDPSAFDIYINEAEKVESGKIKYPVSLEKIARMYRALYENGFASYAEA